MVEERTHSQAREQRSSCAPVQNMDVNVDVDDDNEEEGWHLDAEKDKIEDEIEYAMDVKKIVKE
jgi:hypothetical protein